MLDEPEVGGEILVDGKVRVVRAIRGPVLELEPVEGHPTTIDLSED